MLSKVDCSYRRHLERILEEHDMALPGAVTFHSVETLKRCVTEGVGITILPEISLSAEIHDGRLTPLAWEEGRFEVAILMIWYGGRRVSPALKAFIETAREVLTEN